MADIFSKKKRSQVMSRIRSSGTAPENKLYELVRNVLGFRWRVERNVRTLPGQPDVFVPSLRLALFAHGCFYHGCPKHGHNPKSNIRYWIPKLSRNKQRDRNNRRKLLRLGIMSRHFWEHELECSRSQARSNTVCEKLTHILMHRISSLGSSRAADGSGSAVFHPHSSRRRL
jgi:DNA mismatch endonuclease (patch repair protein)